MTRPADAEEPAWESFTDVIERVTAPVAKAVSGQLDELTTAITGVQDAVEDVGASVEKAGKQLTAADGRQRARRSAR